MEQFRLYPPITIVHALNWDDATITVGAEPGRLVFTPTIE